MHSSQNRFVPATYFNVRLAKLHGPHELADLVDRPLRTRAAGESFNLPMNLGGLDQVAPDEAGCLLEAQERPFGRRR